MNYTRDRTLFPRHAVDSTDGILKNSVISSIPLSGISTNKLADRGTKYIGEIKGALPKGLHADHIWSHVKTEVHIHCWEQDGKIWYLPRYSGRYPVEVVGLYVHPRTGLLRLKAERARNTAANDSKATIKRIKLTEAAEYRNINAIWYYLEFGPADPLAPSGAKREIVKKAQLNRKELRQLRADHPTAA